MSRNQVPQILSKSAPRAFAAIGLSLALLVGPAVSTAHAAVKFKTVKISLVTGDNLTGYPVFVVRHTGSRWRTMGDVVQMRFKLKVKVRRGFIKYIGVAVPSAHVIRGRITGVTLPGTKRAYSGRARRVKGKFTYRAHGSQLGRVSQQAAAACNGQRTDRTTRVNFNVPVELVVEASKRRFNSKGKKIKTVRKVFKGVVKCIGRA